MNNRVVVVVIVGESSLHLAVRIYSLGVLVLSILCVFFTDMKKKEVKKKVEIKTLLDMKRSRGSGFSSCQAAS